MTWMASGGAGQRRPPHGSLKAVQDGARSLRNEE